MEKIIKNHRYNTESATKIGSTDAGHEFGHNEFYTETLYKKKTGEYFLHGDGDANSKYPVEKITPITEAEATTWIEENVTVEEKVEEIEK
jgi:hypothetical protein